MVPEPLASDPPNLPDPERADETLAQALIAIAGSQHEEAHNLVRQVTASNPADPLAVPLLRFLERSSENDVYGAPTAFQQFIDNGSNPSLYQSTIHLLGSIHQTRLPHTVLDIGCGDGRVTDHVLQSDTRDQCIDLVEPSAELLSQASTRLKSQPSSNTNRTVRAHHQTLKTFLEKLDDAARFDLVQATFAMHTLLPDDREQIFADLASRTDRLIIVDFDVPRFADRSIGHARYAVQRYRDGIAEYRDHPIVVEDFLLPVLVGQFDPTQERLTFEQPASRWAAQLQRAGFRTTLTNVAPYWWAPAFLLEADR